MGHFHPSGCHSAHNGNVNCQNHTWVTKNSGHGVVILLPAAVESRSEETALEVFLVICVRVAVVEATKSG